MKKVYSDSFTERINEYCLSRSGYLPEDLKNVASAETFKEMFDIANRVLNRFGTLCWLDEKETAFISSPMTSGNEYSIEENSKLMLEAALFLDGFGSGFMTSFCQLPFTQPIDNLWHIKLEQGLADGGTQKEVNDNIYRELMDDLYGPVIRHFSIDYLPQMPGWEKSLGAIEENDIAEKRNKESDKKIKIFEIWPEAMEEIKAKALSC